MHRLPSLLLLATMPGLAVTSCAIKPPPLIDLQVTVTPEAAAPAIRPPRAIVTSGESTMFSVDGGELHVTPSVKHGLVMINVRMVKPPGDARAQSVVESPEVTVAAGPDRIMMLKMDTMTISIRAVISKSPE